MRTRPSALEAPRTVPLAVLTWAFETLAARTMNAAIIIERDEIGMALDHTNHPFD